jgi:hypothetical protein
MASNNLPAKQQKKGLIPSNKEKQASKIALYYAKGDVAAAHLIDEISINEGISPAGINVLGGRLYVNTSGLDSKLEKKKSEGKIKIKSMYPKVLCYPSDENNGLAGVRYIIECEDTIENIQARKEILIECLKKDMTNEQIEDLLEKSFLLPPRYIGEKWEDLNTAEAIGWKWEGQTGRKTKSVPLYGNVLAKAETGAANRAKRSITGTGLTSVEELPDCVINEAQHGKKEEDKKSPAQKPSTNSPNDNGKSTSSRETTQKSTAEGNNNSPTPTQNDWNRFCTKAKEKKVDINKIILPKMQEKFGTKMWSKLTLNQLYELGKEVFNGSSRKDNSTQPPVNKTPPENKKSEKNSSKSNPAFNTSGKKVDNNRIITRDEWTHFCSSVIGNDIEMLEIYTFISNEWSIQEGINLKLWQLRLLYQRFCKDKQSSVIESSQQTQISSEVKNTQKELAADGVPAFLEGPPGEDGVPQGQGEIFEDVGMPTENPLGV